MVCVCSSVFVWAHVRADLEREEMPRLYYEEKKAERKKLRRETRGVRGMGWGWKEDLACGYSMAYHTPNPCL